MTRRVLVSGACGFAGRHMCAHLAAVEPRPHIVGVDVVPDAPQECDAFSQVDLSLAAEVARVVEEVRPDCVIHLAGRFEAEDPQDLYRANALSALALLDAVRRFTPAAVVVVAGSASEWGRVASEQLPLVESAPCRPVTPYGLSKLLATQIATQHHRVHDVCAMVVRPFQLIGPGVSARLAPGAFAEQLARAAREGSGVIRVGNLETSRDFLDVRDAVRAIWMLCEKPAGGEIFNLCSGTPTKLADLLQLMLDCSGAEVSVEADAKRFDAGADIPQMYGNATKLRCHTGWEPRIDLAQSVRDTLRL